MMKKIATLGILITSFLVLTGVVLAQDTVPEACRLFQKDEGGQIIVDREDYCETADFESGGRRYVFYEGDKICTKVVINNELGRIDGEVQCWEREKPTPTQPAAKQPSPKPTATSEKSDGQEETAAKVLVFGIDVKAGDTITEEGKSKIVIFMPDGTKIDLKEGAGVKFHSEDEIEAQNGIFRFLIDRLTGKVKKVITPGAAIGVRGTEFLVEVGDNGSTTVKVIDGTVEISSIEGKGTVQVVTGQETKIAKGGLPTKPKVFDPKTLDRWWKELPAEMPSKVGSPLLYIFAGVLPIVIVAAVVFWFIRRRKK